MKKLYLVLATIPLFLSLNCNPDELLGGLFKSPSCSVSSIQELDGVDGLPAKFVIMVSNSGDATAFNVGCNIKIKNGNTIISTGLCTFGSLEPGESAEDYTYLHGISKQTDYQSYEVKVYWYDDENKYYEK